MELDTLKAELLQNHREFSNYVDSISHDYFEASLEAKWSVGQELDHILKSTFPIAKVLQSKEYLKDKFGEIDRSSMPYDEVINQYNLQLQKGAVATDRFIPDPVSWDQKRELISNLKGVVATIVQQMDNYSADELTSLAIPHPLLGKLSVLEMLYFTNHHVQHHHRNAVNNLEALAQELSN
jgi:hypothetical protein